MKSRIFTIISAIILSTFATNSYSQIDGHHCGFDHVHSKQINNDPNFKKSESELNSFIKEFVSNKKNSSALSKKSQAPAFVIPVVFHVIHDGGEENISYEQILSAIDRLNECYNGTNPELSSIQSDFTGLVGVANVEFKLATKAPDGTCFRGVTRTRSKTTFENSETAQFNAVVSGNDVYQGYWPSNEYLNIFTADVISSPGAAAYAYFPNSTSMSQGVWSQHIYIGSIGTSTAGRSGTVVHELGHWFALYHPWGSKGLVSADPVPSDCGQEDDLVADTPSTIGNKSCNVNSNTCDSDNSYWGYDIRDNVENFMEYSYCFKMFTQGQSDRMVAALNSSTGGRNNLWSASNLDKTGVNLAPTLCKAEFTSDRTTICIGETIEFTDESFSNQNDWTWSFNGGDVVGSLNDKNPSVTFNSPGVYSISLTVSDGSTSITETKNDYITVLPGAGLSPLQEGFELSENLPNDNWFITSENPTDIFISDDASSMGEKSLKFKNGLNRDGNIYEVTSTSIDLSQATSPVISFDRAFAKRNSSDKDFLQIFASNDCGATFVPIKYLSAIILSTADDINSSFTPSSGEEWANSTINIPAEYYTENFRMKFVFTSNGGNNLFIDNINIGDADSFVSINDFAMDGNKYQLSPNPTQNEINLTLDLKVISSVKLDVFDVLGKKITSFDLGNISKGTNSKKLALSDIEAGTYFFNISINDLPVSTERIIIQ